MSKPLFGRTLGGALGGAAGFLATEASWSRGLPFLVLVGLGIGLGAGLFAKSRSRTAALSVGIFGLAAPVLYLWLHHDTLIYRTFTERMLELPGMLWLQVLASGVLAFVLGLGPAPVRGQPNSTQQPTSAPSGARG